MNIALRALFQVCTSFLCVALMAVALASATGGAVLLFSAFFFEAGFVDWQWNLSRFVAGALLVALALPGALASIYFGRRVQRA